MRPLCSGPEEKNVKKGIAFRRGCIRVTGNHLSSQNLGKMESGIWGIIYFGCLILFERAGYEKV